MTSPAPALRVPYVTAWSGEAVPQDLWFRYHQESAGLRLEYRNPHPDDWRYGVLRARHGLAPGQGRPEWRLVHTYRQWRSMEHLLCQVCARTATDPKTGRVWWVLTNGDADGIDPGAGYTNAPPTCRACVPDAIASCPRLRKGAAVYTVGSAWPWAVLGDEFAFGAGGAKRVDRNVLVELDEFRRLNGILAHQLVAALDDLQREVLP